MCIDNLELANFVCDNMELSQIMNGLAQLSIKIADEENFRRITLGSKATHYSPENYFPTTDSLNWKKWLKGEASVWLSKMVLWE